MSNKKYSKAWKIYLIYIVGLSILFLIAYIFSDIGESTNQLSPVIPGRNVVFEMFFVLVGITTMASLLGSLISGFILAPVMMILHKLIKRKNYDFGIDKRPDSDVFRNTFRGAFPAIMAINFALMLSTNSNVVRFVLDENYWLGGVTSDNYIATLFVGSGYLLFIGMMIFVPIWFILDAGIVYTNKKDEKKLDIPIEARTMGGWYLIVFKGYAGIGATFSFYMFAYKVVTGFVAQNPLQLIMIFIIVFGLPVFLAISCIPSLIFLDKIKDKRNRYVRKIAMKLGIKDNVDILFRKSDLQKNRNQTEEN